MKKPTERFTETVQDYLKYRPSYPIEILQVLINECNLTKDNIIADIGSGTGFLSKLFLDYGNTVYGIEPNPSMREAAEQYLKKYPHFHSVNGTAETTTLAEKSIDMITVGTAFHWFNAEKTQIEFERIAKSQSWVCLVWNVRNIAQSKLLRDYENLILHYGTDYQQSNAQKFDKNVELFNFNEIKIKSFKNTQLFDWEGLKGRLLSTSYSPRPGNTGYEEMLGELKNIFDRYQQNGQVEFLYETKMYYGRIGSVDNLAGFISQGKI